MFFLIKTVTHNLCSSGFVVSIIAVFFAIFLLKKFLSSLYGNKMRARGTRWKNLGQNQALDFKLWSVEVGFKSLTIKGLLWHFEAFDISSLHFIPPLTLVRLPKKSSCKRRSSQKEKSGATIFWRKEKALWLSPSFLLLHTRLLLLLVLTNFSFHWKKRALFQYNQREKKENFLFHKRKIGRFCKNGSERKRKRIKKSRRRLPLLFPLR